MQIIGGKKIAEKMLTQIADEVKKLSFTPVFCDVLVGNDPVSISYVSIKGRTAEKAGIKFQLAQFQENITETELLARIQELNKKRGICGLIVQLPLPASINRQTVLDAIRPELDVDCLGSHNQSKFYNNYPGIVPPTAGAVMRLLGSLDINIPQQKIAVIGQGILVGKPLAHLFRSLDADVSVADKNTRDLSSITRSADIVITATGQPNLIKGDILKLGSVVIDAGTAEMDGGIVGDVDVKSVENTVAFLSPVPGGVGPVTVAQLLQNVLQVAKSKTK